jgi:hypothetical protein
MHRVLADSGVVKSQSEFIHPGSEIEAGTDERVRQIATKRSNAYPQSIRVLLENPK